MQEFETAHQPAIAQETHRVGEMTLTSEEATEVYKKNYSPYGGRGFPTRVFWGDTHLHTSNSLDAKAGGVLLGPAEAFRFARGEEVRGVLTPRLGEHVLELSELVAREHHAREVVPLHPQPGTAPSLSEPRQRLEGCRRAGQLDPLGRALLRRG